jgi:hypothetical protein
MTRPRPCHMTEMLQRARQSFYILAFLLSAHSAAAQDRCASKSDDWTCYSTIEIQPEAGGDTWRMVIFPTQELLAEVARGGVTKRYLALPSGIQLYSGLSAEESISPGQKNPFAFLDLGFALPITALRAAFPLGPASVADGESKKDILVQGKPITISTIRHDAHKISYRLESASIHATGLWERVVQPPLPGSYSLVGWVSPTNVSFATLEEARSARAPH